MSLAVALLSSGVIAAIPPPPSFPLPSQLTRVAPPATRAPPRDIFRPGQKACDPTALLQAGFAPAQLRRLDQLPPAYHHLAVERTVAGCSIATVKIGSAVYWVPLNPQPGREVEPLSPPGVTPLDGRSRTP